jgi:hypothetical protein
LLASIAPANTEMHSPNLGYGGCCFFMVT